MFNPKFSYTNRLVRNISTISELIGGLKSKRFPITILMKVEKDARTLSAYASTTIEGNPLPLTEIRKIIKNNPNNLRSSEKEVINYNEALLFLENYVASVKDFKLTDSFIKNIQKIAVQDLVPKHNTGRYRSQPVLVNDPRTGNVAYLPPDQKEVKKLMVSLLEFINKNKNSIDYLILAGIFHKQFVVIHPFINGNGRTTRLITKALLANMGLNTFKLFSFENYYNQNITRYFSKVGVFGDYYELKETIDFTEWLEYFTEGIIDELLRVSKLLQQSTSLADRIEDRHDMILRLIEEKGAIQDSDYSSHTTRSKASRVSDFQRLIDLELIERKGNGRSTYYVFRD